MTKFNFKNGATIYLIAIGADFALQFGAAIVFSAAGAMETFQADWVQTLFMVCIQIAFFLGVFFYCKDNKERTKGLALNPVPAAVLAIGGVAAFVSMICFYPIAGCFQMLLEAIGYRSQGGPNMDSVAAKIIGAFAIVVAAPIMEEIVFRGALVSGLKEKFGKIGVALLSGIAFSLMHMNPEQTVYQFFLGFVLALIVFASGSVLPGIIGHSVSNLMALLFMFFPVLSAPLDVPITALAQIPVLLVIVSLIMTALGIAAAIFTAKYIGKKYGEIKTREFTAVPPELSETEQTPEEAEKSSPLLKQVGLGGLTLLMIGLGVCAVMWLSNFAVAMMPPIEMPSEAIGKILLP